MSLHSEDEKIGNEYKKKRQKKQGISGIWLALKSSYILEIF